MGARRGYGADPEAGPAAAESSAPPGAVAAAAGGGWPGADGSEVTGSARTGTGAAVSRPELLVASGLTSGGSCLGRLCLGDAGVGADADAGVRAADADVITALGTRIGPPRSGG